jgi:hypothetical protein
MRAFIVSAEFGDFLGVTLPYNRHHFDEVTVITSRRDRYTIARAEENNADVFLTECWWDCGAMFDKWKALEKCLDAKGTHGPLCLMDADILWPKNIGNFKPKMNHLYTPHRRILKNHLGPIPPEKEWKDLPRAWPDEEFVGYTQVFYGEDIHVAEKPWFHGLYETYGTAGFADVYFQARWPHHKKFRPPWEVLHLGLPMENWCGRTSQAMTGKWFPKRHERMRILRQKLRNVLTIPARFRR